ncbi:hypothetical protein HAX54_004664, partial [Datura stramonium]|nr:hypothetical protein [Datura stramonium]
LASSPEKEVHNLWTFYLHAIVKSLNRVNEVENAPHMAGISHFFMVENKNKNWIIDSGATNHMTSYLTLLNNEESVKKDDSQK